MRLAGSDPDAALEWAATVGSEREIAAANAQIALVLAETDPQRAAELLAETGMVGRELDVAVVAVLQRWAARAPADAAAWAVLLPTGEARATGMVMIAERWLPLDASAALGWLGAVRDEALRQEVARAMEGFILQQPPEIRDAWLQLADMGIRTELERQRGQATMDVGNNIPPGSSLSAHAVPVTAGPPQQQK